MDFNPKTTPRQKSLQSDVFLSLICAAGPVRCRCFSRSVTDVLPYHGSHREQPGARRGRRQTPFMSPLLLCQPWLCPSRVGHTLNINLIGPGRALLTYAKHQTDMSLFPQSPRTLRIKDNNMGSNLL